jgi:hypothetical protein
MTESQVRAIERIAEEYRFGSGSLHAHKVADLASSLFDQLSSLGLLPGLSISDRRTLVAAGYTHDVGSSPRALQEIGTLPPWAPPEAKGNRHHVLSFGALRTRSEDSIPTFKLHPLSAVDRSTLLYSVLWNSASNVYEVKPEPLFDRERTTLLAGILRIADALDTRHRLMVQDVHVKKASTWIRLLVHTFDEAGAEVAQARRKSGMLSDALGIRIFVQEVLGEEWSLSRRMRRVSRPRMCARDNT